MSNKLYDSFYFKKPLLTNSETIMSEIAGDFSFDLDKCGGNLDTLFDWYNSIDSDKMIEYMNSKFSEYLKDMKNFNESLEEIFK